MLRGTEDEVIDFEERNENDENVIVHLPNYFYPLCYKKRSIYYNKALEYLYSRNVTQLDILRQKIGYCEEGDFRNRIIFPSFDCDGKLNYFIGRSYFDNVKVKYKNANIKKSKIVFNELYINFSKPVVLCEGVFDCFTCGENSIPLLGSTINEALIEKLVSFKCPCVYVSIDPDTYHFEDSKNSKILKISNKLKRYKIETRFVDIRPFKDPGEMTKKDFEEKKSKAVDIDDDFIFSMKIGDLS